MQLPLETGATLLDCLQHYAALQPQKRAYTYVADGGADERCLTYQELDARASRLAWHMAQQGWRGKAAVLMFPSGLEFVVAFFACLKAQVIAVPANVARNQQHFARLRLIIQDSAAPLVLTTAALKSSVHAGLQRAGADAQDVQVVEEADAQQALPLDLPPPAAETLAFLQYTSGSTGTPKGVMVNHGQLLANERAIAQAGGLPEFAEVGGWLPQFHDMGLIGTTLQPIALGGHYAFMSPLHFIQRPLRWLELMSRFGSHASAAPNFALEMCVKAWRALAPEARPKLDLSQLISIFCGAEPVQATTLLNFRECFAESGLQASAVRPCYGLAEATLLVSGGDAAQAQQLLALDRSRLSQGEVAAADGAERQLVVCCGKVADGHEVRIADPDNCSALADGQVGELWVRGPSIACGYWQKQEASQATFGAMLKDGSGPYMRTGDMAFIQNGGLYITGRIKEMMIVRGRNYYPNDIEHSIKQELDGQWGGLCAVFALDGDGSEKVAVALEAERKQAACEETQSRQIVALVRQTVSQQYDLQLADVVFVSHGTIPRTSSGKIQRLRCSQMYPEWRSQSE